MVRIGLGVYRLIIEPYYFNDYSTLYNGNCIDILKDLDLKFDLVVTSPPYDNLRDYGNDLFNFESIAEQLIYSLKEGGIIVWIVNDSTINGSETGTSFRQALSFIDMGLNLHDTMIYQKNSASFPEINRYYNIFEYMFIFSKGKPKTTNLINDRKNKYGGTSTWGKITERQKSGTLRKKEMYKIVKEYGVRWNIWKYNTGGLGLSSPDFPKSTKHPAIFPYKLAYDHIITWSNENDLVLDPMAGSGTVLKAAESLGRKSVGIEIYKPYCDLIVERLGPQTIF